MDMGFPRSAARTALIRCRNNVPVATEYLLQHPDVVGAGRIEDEAALIAPADPEPDAAPDAPAAIPAVDDAVVPPIADGAEPVPAPDVLAADAPVVNQDQDVQMNDAAVVPVVAPVHEAPSAEPVVEATPPVDAARKLAAKETKDALDIARAELKPTFLPKALLLAEDYSDLVFEIKNAYGLLYPSKTGESGALTLQPLLDDFAERTTGEAPSEEAVATRIRVIALACTDAVFREAVESSREALMAIVVRFQRQYLELAPSKDARPKWLAAVMLVADSLLSYSDVPAPTTILAEGDAVPEVELVSQGPAWLVERQGFFDLAMDLVVKGVSERGTFISTLRLLLILTRDHALAVKFVERDGLRHLFDSLHTADPETEGCHSYAVMIVRHVVEEVAILRPIMEREIEAWFAQSRAKVAEVTVFLRGVNSIAFRNTPVFLEATKATCKLAQADATTNYHIGLLNEPQPLAKPTEADSTIRSPFAGDGTTATDTNMLLEDAPAPKPAKDVVSPNVDSTVHFLMAEIMVRPTRAFAICDQESDCFCRLQETSKLALASYAVPSTPTAANDAPLASVTPATPDVAIALDGAAEATPAAAPALKADDKATPDHFHTSFALSTLSELLSSYSVCKTSFLTFSTRRPKDTSGSTAAATTPKSRSSFLYFLLNDLIPVGTVVPASDAESRKRATLSMWASLVIISLCCDPDATTPTKDSAHEIAQVRKGALDAIARAFKEATASTEPTDVRYGRMFALSDLCYRLLTSRAYPGLAKPRDDTSMQLAKLMLEKNFAVILTNALADVDLNFPSVNNLINGILRPLEQLTKVVTKVGRAKTSAPPTGGLDDDDSTDGSSMDEDEDNDTEDEPEAPDLYRNSALGLYEGQLEPSHDAYNSDDEDEYDEDDEVRLFDLSC